MSLPSPQAFSFRLVFALFAIASLTAQDPAARAPLPTAAEFEALLKHVRAGLADGFTKLRGAPEPSFDADGWHLAIPPGGATGLPAQATATGRILRFPDGRITLRIDLHEPRAVDAAGEQRLTAALAQWVAVMERTRDGWHLTKEEGGDAVTVRRDSWVLHRDAEIGGPLVRLTFEKIENYVEPPPNSILHWGVRVWATLPPPPPPKEATPEPEPLAKGLGVPVSAVAKGLGEFHRGHGALPWNGHELRGSGRLEEGDRIAAIDGVQSPASGDWRAPLRQGFARGHVDLLVERSGAFVPLHLDLRPTVEPLDGDCRDGEGRARLPGLGAVYAGRFADGLPAGPGRLTFDDGYLLLGWFERGLPGTPVIGFDSWNNTGGSNAIAWRGRIVDLKEQEKVELPAWGGVDGKLPGHTLDGYEHGPVALARGELLARIETQDLCEVRFPNWGVYTGRFVDGVAQGQGILVRPDGTAQKFDCLNGVPALVASLHVPGGERAQFVAARGDQLLPLGDCLQGNARDGTATLILARNARGAATIYEGQLSNGRPHGHGRLRLPGDSAFAWPTFYEGPFLDGVRHGRFTVTGDALPPRHEDFAYGEFVASVQPGRATNAPAPTQAHQRRTYVSKCYSCSGYGTVLVASVTHSNDTIMPFMPGSRHYGSWLLQGTYDPTKTQTHVEHTSQPCARCQGRGRVNIDY